MKYAYSFKIFKRFFYLCFLFMSLKSFADDRIKESHLHYDLLKSTDWANLSVTIKITGTVTDDTGEPLPGVSIKVKDTNIATTTSVDGKYTINAPDANAKLQFSFIGFIAQEVTIGSRTTINIQLKNDTKLLNEVTVVDVGFGNTEKRADLTGSIASVNVKDLQKAPVTSFEQALAGRVAGVQVISSDGQPGDPLQIVVRGASSINNSNSPLYVIDGLPVEDPDNNNLNPAEIESITILKDASSTAIYGSRAANGVVIITTKQGKLGKSVVNYNNYFGQNITTGRVDLMNAAEFVNLQYELDPAFTDRAYFNKNPDGSKFIDSLPQYDITNYENAPSLDFQNKVFVKGFFQNHFLSVSGGSQNGSRYLFSGGLTDMKGIIIASGFKRYQGRFNIDQVINDKFKITANLNYASTLSYGTFPRSQESNNGGLGNLPTNNLLYRIWAFRPTNIFLGNVDLVDDEFDEEPGSPSIATSVFNPFLSAKNQENRRYGSAFSASTSANYKFNSNFSYRLNASMSLNGGRREKFEGPKTNSGLAYGANGSILNSATNNFSIDNLLTFNKRFSKKSSLTVIALASQQWRRVSSNGYNANQILNSSLGIGGLSSGTVQPTINFNLAQDNLLGFGGTATFNYIDKYIFKGSFRTDGSSKFAKGNRWGYFPSGGFAWKASEEDFMKNVKVISDLKFRINYGETGNNRIGPYPYASPIGQTNTSGFIFNNTFNYGFFQTSIGNKDLKWETTAQLDAGIEFKALKQRLSFELDYYNKRTRDLLLFADFPLSSGFDRGLVNIGKINNQGFEFTLIANVINSKSFTWNSNFNISFNKNKIVELADGNQNLINRAEVAIKNPTFNYISQVGKPIGSFYGLTYDGVYQYTDFNQLPSGGYVLKDELASPNGGSIGYDRNTVKPGDAKYRDINKDGLIDDNDIGIIGQSSPKAIGGFNNNFSYKAFSLNIFFQYSYGGANLNYNKYFLEIPKLGFNQFASYNNRWTPTNPSNYAPGVNASGVSLNSTRFVEDNSYLRFKTVQLSYSFPSQWLQRSKIRSLSINASAQNLWTITNYSGPDPEANTASDAPGLTPNYDFSAYPRAFTYTFGLNVTF
ncbi:TonB-dependent receptor [Pedobacter sp. SD-b]|uniref:TonB-dependent receptor n=1 Tax=Pedobacter segetis TaxID=2793069 RepID=A0ABS1BGE0_9SPHI|nr:TonB-dependent receptor [Pedobacter segetis]MBK0381935.1 TonB-dependent receptor [Pedobacter segetis]